MLQGTHSFFRSTRGVYFASSGILSIVATAHASTAGFWWLINPLNSGIKIIVRRITFEHSCIAAAAANTRVTIERITFPDGPASALVGSLKRDSGYPAALGLVLSASTGITPVTVNSNAVCYTTWSPPVITAAGVLTPVEDTWWPLNEDSLPILAAGEGLVARQPDNGVTTDPRRLVISVEWEEYS